MDKEIEELMAVVQKTWDEAIEARNIFQNAPSKLFYYRKDFMNSVRKKLIRIIEEIKPKEG